MSDTITYDAVADMVSAITAQWDGGTACAGTLPRIREVWNVKVVGFGSENQEEIIIKPGYEQIEPFQLHGDTYWHTLPMEIDIRVYSSITRLNTVVKEVERIVKNMIRRDAQGFLQVVIKNSQSKVPEYRNMYRHCINLTYEAAKSHTFV